MIEERQEKGAYEALPLFTRICIRILIKLLHLVNYLVGKEGMYASFEVGYIPEEDIEFDMEDEDYLQ